MQSVLCVRLLPLFCRWKRLKLFYSAARRRVRRSPPLACSHGRRHAARPNAPKPSIVRGFRCLVQGLRHARGTPGLKGAYGHYALALVVVSLVLGALFVLGAQHGVEWLSNRYAAHLPDDESLRHVLDVLATVIATLLPSVPAPRTVRAPPTTRHPTRRPSAPSPPLRRAWSPGSS